MTKKQIEAMMSKQKEASKSTPFLNTEMGQFSYQLGFEDGVYYALSHQWVSVEDELPKREERYSKYVIMRNRIGGHYIGCYDFEGKLWLDGNLEMIYMDITHWMPIPPLAEEGGEDGLC